MTCLRTRPCVHHRLWTVGPLGEAMFDEQLAKLRDVSTPLLEKRDILWLNRERPPDQRGKFLQALLADPLLPQQSVPAGIGHHIIDDDGVKRSVIRIGCISGVFWDQEHVLAVVEEDEWLDAVRMVPWETVRSWQRRRCKVEAELRDELRFMCEVDERGVNVRGHVRSENEWLPGQDPGQSEP